MWSALQFSWVHLCSLSGDMADITDVKTLNGILPTLQLPLSTNAGCLAHTHVSIIFTILTLLMQGTQSLSIRINYDEDVMHPLHRIIAHTWLALQHKCVTNESVSHTE
jgi:hypothetical protein